MYDGWVIPHVTRRTFYLRNLKGDTLEQQIEHAKMLLDELSQEIHYITGVGIDKGVIKVGNKKVIENVYQLEPHEAFAHFRYSVKINFRSASSFLWQKDGKKIWRISEADIDNGWEKIQIEYPNKSITFTLPCIALPNRTKGEPTFLKYPEYQTRGRSRKTGWYVAYDQDDVTLHSFLNKFYPNGYLSVGKGHYFGKDIRHTTIEGSSMPARKKKRTKAPRKSSLASQPTDNTDYVYVIQMGNRNIFKIGKSNEPGGRLANLQTASPYKLKLLHFFAADNASAAEEQLHAELYEKRLQGEWFRLTNQRKTILSSIEKFVDGQFIVGNKKLSVKELFASSL